MVGTIASDGTFETNQNPSVLDSAVADLAVAAHVEHQIMHVQLRPGLQMLPKCIAHLKATAAKHPDAAITVAGYNEEDNQFILTLAIDLGPRDQIAKFSDESVAAFNLVNALFTEMFDFLPQYTGIPSAEDSARAATLPPFLAPAAADVLDAKAA